MSNQKPLLIAGAYILEPDEYLQNINRKLYPEDQDCRCASEFYWIGSNSIQTDINKVIDLYNCVFEISTDELLRHSKYAEYVFESTITRFNVYRYTFLKKEPDLIRSFNVNQFPYHYAAIGIVVKDYRRYYPKISDYRYMFGTCEADVLRQLSEIPYQPDLDIRMIIKFPLNHLGGPKYAWCQDEQAWDYDRFPTTLRSDHPERDKQLNVMSHIDQYHEYMRYIMYEVDQVDDDCQISKRTWMYGDSRDVEEYSFGDCIPLIK